MNPLAHSETSIKSHVFISDIHSQFFSILPLNQVDFGIQIDHLHEKTLEEIIQIDQI